jgi:hypothetical protein
METLVKHLISVVWRLSAMFIVVVVNLAFYMEYKVAMTAIPTIVVGVIAGEFTKWLNTAVKGKKLVEFEVKTKKTIAKKKK